jgi:magnesium transporter
MDVNLDHFHKLPRAEAEDVFLGLSALEQAELLLKLPYLERRSWLRFLEPDDVADVIQEAPEDEKPGLLGLLDDVSQKEVIALLAYSEDEAGGLMSPRFARVRPDMTIDEAIRYLRKQAPQVETIHYAYVLDFNQTLLGVISIRHLFFSNPGRRVKDVMNKDIISVPEEMSQHDVGMLLSQHDLVAMPVVDPKGIMKGIITFDDIADVISEEATEDIQRIGGTEALDLPYLKTRFFSMVQKRVGWLAFLFFGEMLTATAMGYFENEIAKAVVLALFIPLIISSGGNSGSQASTLVIRAMALGEVLLKDWGRVLRREIASGIVMGGILGAIGFVRILIWHWLWGSYGEHYVLVGLTIALSLVGVVSWGTISGSMLPFVMRLLKFDPASASTPFVATLVDVTGLIIYFSIASVILSGILVR